MKTPPRHPARAAARALRRALAPLPSMLAACRLLAASPAPAAAPGRTSFQTNVPFDARLHLETDICIVHRHGAHDIAAAIRSWADRGYAVHRMFFSGSDAGQIYVEGTWDGQTHRDEAETTSAGELLGVAPMGRAYMVPTPGWTDYTRHLVRESVAAGARAVLPEEPLAHTSSGYGAAFQRLWQQEYGSTWVDPQSSVNAFFKASRLKSKLYLDLVAALLAETDAAARDAGRDVAFILPVHSPVSYAGGDMLFAHAAAWRLPGLDGFIAQVWTGPSRWTVARSSVPLSRRTFFLSTYLLYSPFAALARGAPDRAMYALADPVEDDPSHSWPEYEQWYRETLTAMLLFPEIKRYEVMPWPDRVFLPGYHMAGGTPAPEPYRVALLSAFRMLEELASWPSAVPGQRRVGVLIGDTLGWQRGGPHGSSMDSLLGITFPLLEQGTPVQLLPIEESFDPAFLAPYELLILSYDMWKPLEPAAHAALDAWTRAGGALLFLGGSDPYNEVDEWWRRAGFAAPQDHLFAALGAIAPGTRGRALEAGPRPQAGDAAHPADNRRALACVADSPWRAALEPIRLPPDARVTTYAPPAAATVLAELDGAPIAFEQTVGRGRLLFLGLEPRLLATQDWGAPVLRALAGELWRRNGRSAEPLLAPGRLNVWRGPYLALRTFDRPHPLQGAYIDVLDPHLTVQVDPEIPPDTAVVLKEVSAFLDPPRPRLLHGNARLRDMQVGADRIRFAASMPEGTPAALRFAFPADARPAVEARAHDGAAVTPTLAEDSATQTWLLELPGRADGVAVIITCGPR